MSKREVIENGEEYRRTSLYCMRFPRPLRDDFIPGERANRKHVKLRLDILLREYHFIAWRSLSAFSFLRFLSNLRARF